jgi:hypothetical protein
VSNTRAHGSSGFLSTGELFFNWLERARGQNFQRHAEPPPNAKIRAARSPTLSEVTSFAEGDPYRFQRTKPIRRPANPSKAAMISEKRIAAIRLVANFCLIRRALEEKRAITGWNWWVGEGAAPSRHANLAFTRAYKAPPHGWCYPPVGRVLLRDQAS